MKITHHDLRTDLSDDWWTEAEMGGFVPTTRAYRADQSPSENEPIKEVCIADVGPVGAERRAIGIFRDSSDGVPGRERVIKILRGFRLGEAIPPVKVVENKPGSRHRYKLTDGTHRLYCSLAAGFTHVPAVEGCDLDALDR